MAYWLMKSEPDAYSIDDLAKEGAGMWEGCRNYTVRNFLRDTMQKGDRALFYHSSVDPAGVVGEMEIASDAYPDPTQFDPENEYYDAKSPKENPRWFARDVKFIRKFPEMVTLALLKATPGLDAMGVVKRGQRLSIMPVTAAEWEIVMGLAGK
ncbi:MAG TPA: EVE domain-containing protein [Fimbriimonadaceae bacterium]|nr:EVE domain-containing protein [Fimbriimonadaceae bacterium]